MRCYAQTKAREREISKVSTYAPQSIRIGKEIRFSRVDVWHTARDYYNYTAATQSEKACLSLSLSLSLGKENEEEEDEVEQEEQEEREEDEQQKLLDREEVQGDCVSPVGSKTWSDISVLHGGNNGSTLEVRSRRTVVSNGFLNVVGVRGSPSTCCWCERGVPLISAYRRRRDAPLRREILPWIPSWHFAFREADDAAYIAAWPRVAPHRSISMLTRRKPRATLCTQPT